MTRRDLPNLISILRLLLILPVVLMLLDENYAMALTLFAVAGVSDGLDGYLAKHYGWVSRLGSILDPLADKLLLVSTYLALGYLGQMPVWLVTGVVVRDALIFAGAVAYHLFIGKFDLMPTMLSKINTFVQIGLVLIVMLSVGLLPIPEWFTTTMIYVVMATTVLSGIDYVWTWGQQAMRARSGVE